MLIQKILGRSRIEEYSFIQYQEGDELKTSLALFMGHGYYKDLNNNNDIYFRDLINKELLIMYADISEKWISKNKAKRYAKPYYKEFEKDMLKNEKELTI